jgi:hypothetical protein
VTPTQSTLGGDAFELAEDRATRPDDADVQTPFGGIYEQANGDRTFALHRCPACNAPVNPRRWPDERTVQTVDQHVRAHHDSLEDFGEADVHDDQAKLPLAGEVLRR